MNCSYITKNGDKGKTSTSSGIVPKNSNLISFIGNLDESNSYIGLCLNYCKDKDLLEILLKVQNQIFNIGAKINGANLEITEEYHIWIENKANFFFKKLKPIHNFVLPGGSLFSSHLHICRTILRRTELAFWACEEEHRDVNIGKYLNRISDFFFIIARVYNNEEIQWEVGKID
ncbi:cob(I)yrinic acid a,c-diamide adenosyltransferase [Candidatus Nesciobacter abundans]|uniref:cob(I)yrinic acid a,c-diamide adenosyltransferase n=1 Tax=Candidatus Nesciobacter abundans TaxID=2601668 RepID=UPI001653953F|nr:cob(I)yrinic acid a,c-diamide adenosyltransferase [Candidatus Nesciobacter abundans]